MIREEKSTVERFERRCSFVSLGLFERTPRDCGGDPAVVWWNAMDPLPFPSIVRCPHQPIPVHAWHALHTWIVRLPDRPSSTILGLSRARSRADAHHVFPDPAERVPRARPVRSSRGPRRVRHRAASCN